MQLTPFVDRQKELEALSRLLHGHRLLSLLGPAGIGKTRLALQLAEDARRRFKDGVGLVELATLTDGELLESAIVRSLGLGEDVDRDAMSVIESAVASGHVLLVLDNCEHVVEHVARLLGRLLRTSSGLTVLATSRDRLGVPGEVAWRVPPLSVPGPENGHAPERLAEADGVVLFVDRARRVNPEFAVTADNARDVSELVRRLEGLPLAIELAAGWTATLSPSELVGRLGDRFQLLVARERVVTPRHSSLRAAIDSSYEVLAVPEQEMFRRLGVFAGGWNLDSMAAVCDVEPAAALDLLGRLIDRSLVTVLPSVGAESRYRLLESLREYALGRLRAAGEDAAMQQRFADYFMELVEFAVPRISGREAPAWLHVLDAEYDNISTLLWQESRLDPERKLRVAAAMAPYWHFRGLLSEARRYLSEAVSSAPMMTPVLAHAWSALSRMSWAQGELSIAARQGRQAFRIARRIGDRRGTAYALLRLAQASFDAGRTGYARGWAENALPIVNELPANELRAACLLQLGQIALVEGRLTEAEPLIGESVELFHGLGIVDQEAIASGSLGRLYLRQGRHEDAELALTRCLSLLRPLALPKHTVAILESLAAVAAARGDALRAARLAGAAAGILDRIGARPPATAPMRQLLAAEWEAALAAPGADRAWADGRSMDLDRAMAYVLGEPEADTAAPVASPRTTSPLTRRQLEVARLAVQGLTNKEIATRLFISQRTAEGHIEQIMNKLGFSSRIQIAAWLHEQDSPT